MNLKTKLLSLVLLSTTLAGCGVMDSSFDPLESTAASPKRVSVDISTARAQLEKLPIHPHAPVYAYDRDYFGPTWADTDYNGCDTRNDILNRDLSNVTHKAGTNNCVVTSGTLNDPYSGDIINFTRGSQSSMAVQIDHIVPLANAWNTGASQMDETTRLKFANDPENLLAVDGPTNQAKGAKDAGDWLPTAYRCDYVATQIYIKTKYELWVTESEATAMNQVLETC